MITKEIPTDIRKHKTQLFFGLSTREFFSVATAAVLFYLVYAFQEKTLGIEPNFIYCIPALFPVFFGFAKPCGLPLEKYLKINFVSVFLAPKTRPFKTQNLYSIFISDGFIDDNKEDNENEEKDEENTEIAKEKKSKNKKEKQKNKKADKAEEKRRKEEEKEYVGYL